MGTLGTALGVVAAAVFSAVALATLVGFLENGEAGKRAFGPLLGICGLVGVFQIAPARFAPAMVLVLVFVVAFSWWRRWADRKGS